MRGLHVKVMPSFSSVCLDLPSIPLIVRHSLVLSFLWSMLSTNSLNCLGRQQFSQLSCFVIRCRFGDLIIHCRQPWRCGILLRRSSRSSIMTKISAGTCCVYSLRLPVGIRWEAAFNSVARNNFSSFWQSVGR